MKSIQSAVDRINKTLFQLPKLADAIHRADSVISRMDAEWREEDHPRAANGQFSSGGKVSAVQSAQKNVDEKTQALKVLKENRAEIRKSDLAIQDQWEAELTTAEQKDKNAIMEKYMRQLSKKAVERKRLDDEIESLEKSLTKSHEELFDAKEQEKVDAFNQEPRGQDKGLDAALAIFDKENKSSPKKAIQAYMQARGFSSGVAEYIDTLLHNHTRDATQRGADKQLEKLLSTESVLRDALKTRAELEIVEIKKEEAERATEGVRSFEEIEKKLETKPFSEVKRYLRYGDLFDEYEPYKQFLISRGQGKKAFFRKGGLKDVMSTSTSETGANTTGTSSLSVMIKPDHVWTADDLIAKGYLPVGGVSALLGYVGENEVLWLNFNEK